MTKKLTVMVVVLLVLAGIYVYEFTDWIIRPVIQIVTQSRPVSPRQRWGARSKSQPVSFKLNGDYRLTMVKVVPLDAYQTNKYAIPVWHLTTISNSVPVRGFIYGMPIQGMKPAKTNARPDNLEPSRAYKVLIEAGRARGEDQFKTSPLPPAKNQ